MTAYGKGHGRKIESYDWETQQSRDALSDKERPNPKLGCARGKNPGGKRFVTNSFTDHKKSRRSGLLLLPKAERKRVFNLQDSLERGGKQDNEVPPQSEKAEGGNTNEK